MAYIWLKEELQNAVAKDKKDVALWKKYLAGIPYCDLEDVSGEELLKCILIKGYIDLWKRFPILDDFSADFDFDEDDDEAGEGFYDVNAEAREQLTAKFFFKESNRAVLIYPSSEKLPKFRGTWGQVTIEIIDFVRRKFCEDPRPTKEISERLKLFKSDEN